MEDPTPPPAPTPAAPPAAKAVIEGKTEKEIELERKLAEAEDRAKKAETDASYAQDQARQLKEALNSPSPAPAVPADKPKKSGWRTFWHSDEEEA